jgi:hypothetical protein
MRISPASGVSVSAIDGFIVFPPYLSFLRLPFDRPFDKLRRASGQAAQDRFERARNLYA